MRPGRYLARFHLKSVLANVSYIFKIVCCIVVVVVVLILHIVSIGWNVNTWFEEY